MEAGPAGRRVLVAGAGGPVGRGLAALLAAGAEAVMPEVDQDKLAELFRIRVFEPRDASVTRRRGCGLGSGVFIAEDFRDIGLASLLKEYDAPVEPIHRFYADLMEGG